jgi:hypothetical protein
VEFGANVGTLARRMPDFGYSHLVFEPDKKMFKVMCREFFCDAMELMVSGDKTWTEWWTGK